MHLEQDNLIIYQKAYMLSLDKRYVGSQCYVKSDDVRDFKLYYCRMTLLYLLICIHTVVLKD